jgi:uncharacterized protein (UPF0335 family)
MEDHSHLFKEGDDETAMGQLKEMLNRPRANEEEQKQLLARMKEISEKIS